MPNKIQRDRTKEYAKNRESIIARATAWNKANASRRNAVRREQRSERREAAEREKKHWENRKRELIAEHGPKKGGKRFDYEKNRTARIAKAKEWAAKNRERRREISRKWAAKNRAEDPEAARLADREYYQRNRRRIINKSTDWALDHPKSKEWCKANRDKLIARSLANIAKRCGEIVTDKCVSCGSSSDIEMHHPNYSEPLNVVLLCRICHKKHHQQVSR